MNHRYDVCQLKKKKKRSFSTPTKSQFVVIEVKYHLVLCEMAQWTTNVTNTIMAHGSPHTSTSVTPDRLRCFIFFYRLHTGHAMSHAVCLSSADVHSHSVTHGRTDQTCVYNLICSNTFPE